MEQKLVAEGIEVVNDQVQQFDKVFWDPETELGF
jgi:methylated-DNA-protein-cysteine methyltransferase-like protein